MPATARADLESLLRLKKLDHTLTSGSASLTADVQWVVPTGLPDLDARLQGGIPRGHVSEFVGPRSSGRLAVVLSTVADATSRGEAVAFIDPLDLFDPASASAAGIDFTRMLWIRGQASPATRVSLSCEYGTLQKSLDRAVKALNLVLQAGGFGLVVLDLAEISPHVLRRLPYTTWLRLYRVIEASETACVVMGSVPMARSAGGVTVHLERRLAPDSGLQAPGPTWPEVRPSTSSGRPELVEGRSPKPEANQIVRARVVRSRTLEIGNDVCLPVSAAAC